MHSALCRDLAAHSFAVVPHFLDDALVRELRAEVLALDASSQLKQAGIGRGGDYALQPEIRTDRVLWLDPAACSPAQTTALAALEELRMSLNRSLFIGLRELECHLAAYAPGGRYDKHLDAFRGQASQDSRKISIVLYLNDAWTAADGGALRLYEPDSPETSDTVALDVLPNGGTLVCFLSDAVWHEVLPTKRTRLSLTAWFR